MGTGFQALAETDIFDANRRHAFLKQIL